MVKMSKTNNIKISIGKKSKYLKREKESALFLNKKKNTIYCVPENHFIRLVSDDAILSPLATANDTTGGAAL